MKKWIILIAVLMMTLGFTGCKGRDAEKVVKTYLEAAQTFETETMDACFIPELRRDHTTSSSGRLEAERLFMDYFKESAENITYQINHTKGKEDKIVVNVTCKYVDGSDLYSRSIFRCSEETIQRRNEGETFTPEELELRFEEIIAEERKNQEQVIVKNTFDVECQQVDGEWYISQSTVELGNVATANFFSMGEELADMLENVNQGREK